MSSTKTKNPALDIPDVPRSLNVLLNLHWRNQRKERDKWILLVRSQMDMNGMWLQPIVPMKAKITLYHSRFYDEADNLKGACKPLIDALKHWKLIYDDTPRYFKADIRQEKYPHKRRHTVIELEVA